MKVMNPLLIAISIGVIAGTIDVIPMVLQKKDKFSCLSAFIHWVVLGLIIPYVHWDVVPWVKGSLIGALTAGPVMLLVFPLERKALIPILLFSLFLGAAVGVAGARFVV